MRAGRPSEPAAPNCHRTDIRYLRAVSPSEPAAPNCHRTDIRYLRAVRCALTCSAARRVAALCRLPKAWTASPQVAKQVPSISNLDSRRSAPADGVGIGAGPIAGDDLHPRPIAEPGGNGCGFRIGQEIDYFVCLEIDQHGAVATPTPPSPVVDTKNAGYHNVRLVIRADASRSSVSELVGTEIRVAKRAPASPRSARPR